MAAVPDGRIAEVDRASVPKLRIATDWTSSINPTDEQTRVRGAALSNGRYATKKKTRPSATM